MVVRNPDSLYAALANRQRRVVCLFVVDNDDSVITLDEMTTHLVTEERSGNAKPLADPEYHDRVATLLHHVHLPMLADAAVLEYDHEERLVEPGPSLPLAVQIARAGTELKII